MKPKDAPAASRIPPAGQLGREHPSLGQRVADELRRSILTNRRRPGDRLVEDRLSEELGVSRIPIREALRALAAEGLVDVLPRRGASVADVSPEVARDLLPGCCDGPRSLAPPCSWLSVYR